MRVALISLFERLAGDRAGPLGLRRIGGRSIARHQIDLALAMGCERVICLSEAMHDGLPALQQVAEKAGARFHVVRGSRPLSGLVTSADEVLVMADGLVPDAERVKATIGSRPAILLFPAEPALVAGYERVDAAHGWAGVALLRGSAVERLSDLPPDVDPVSALLRVGLQAGTKQLVVPPEILDEGEWVLVRSSEQLDRMGRQQMARLLQPAPWTAPGLALVDRLVGRCSAWLQDRGIGAKTGAALTATMVLGAVASGYYGPLAAGLFVLVPAAAMARVTKAVGRVFGGAAWPAWLAAAGVDCALLVLAGLNASRLMLWPGLFAPLIALGLLHLASAIVPGKWKFLAQDRLIFTVLLAIATLFGGFSLFFQIVALLALAALLLASRRSRLITV